MFNINDKLVCVDDRPSRRTPSIKHLQREAIYCVGGIDNECAFGPGLYIVGVESPGGRGWYPDRFRLVSEVQAENRLKRTQKKPA